MHVHNAGNDRGLTYCPQWRRQDPDHYLEESKCEDYKGFISAAWRGPKFLNDGRYWF